MKNIVFIEPRSPGYHIFSRYGLPRLGTLILGTILEGQGYMVRVFVEDVEPIDFNKVLDADLVGISTITSTAPRAYEIARQVQKRGIPVVMGGPHVTFMTEEALEYCDYVFRGEAEKSILDFVTALEAGEGIGDIPGLSFRIGDKIFHNNKAIVCSHLDELPFPDFSLIRTKLNKIRPVMTSRGCPYNCSFCSVTPMFGHKYRFNSKEHVLREIRAAPKDDMIFFYDDHFVANPEHTKELLQMMIDEKITPKWTAQVRADSAKDDELLDLMKRSGCVYVYIGMESVNPETLKDYRKGVTAEDIEFAIHRFHDAGIRVHGMFVFGADTDNVESLRATVNFAKKNRIDTVQFMVLTPLPGTEYYKKLDEEGRILTKDWSMYDAHHVVFEPKQMTPLELQIETMKGHSNFYSVWEIAKVFMRMDFYAVFIKFYSNRLARKFAARNRQYMQWVKDLGASYSETLESAISKTSADIRERIQQITAKDSQKKSHT